MIDRGTGSNKSKRQMSKIYVFGIGGTGSRVLRSLTMLLATGVDPGTDEIVPVIIDPDVANADLTRAVTLMNLYNTIHSALEFTDGNQSTFFKTAIGRVTPGYKLSLRDTEDRTFKQFISLSTMSRANRAMARLLFSDRNLDSSMTVGFKGNPNIGSVVLNQVAHSVDFDTFANSFAEGDRVFIVSSIFGGTGASGFPLLLKTLRTGTDFPNHALINHAKIGAISILPYFRVTGDPASEIDSSTFISKTKSALAYYEDNITGNGAVDSLYFLGDTLASTYENHEGGSAQSNLTHLVEFLAATAIIDFGHARHDSPVCLEMGIREATDVVTFASFYDTTRDRLYRPMTRFTLMANALSANLSFYKSATFNANRGNFEGFYTGDFFKSLTIFTAKYHRWLRELKANCRSLELFNVRPGRRPFDLVNGVTPKRIFSRYSDYDLVTARLNTSIGACRSKQQADRFLEMFYRAGDRLVNEKLNPS